MRRALLVGISVYQRSPPNGHDADFGPILGDFTKNERIKFLGNLDASSEWREYQQLHRYSVGFHA